MLILEQLLEQHIVTLQLMDLDHLLMMVSMTLLIKHRYFKQGMV